MRENLKDLISVFLEQSKTNNLASSHFASSYSGFKLKIGFGVGNIAKISWIVFLGTDQKPQDGIFPVYYFFKEQNKLILAYGISETNIPNKKWKVPLQTKTIAQYFKSSNIEPYKYGLSYVYKVYDVTTEMDWNQMEKDLEELLNEYNDVLSNT